MDTIQAIILAIVEGLTEFLPISSTAHMKITDFLMGAQPSAFRDMFEVIIQLAAIMAVVVLYWKKFFNFKNISFYIKLIVAVIPALVAGALLKKHIDAALDNLWIISVVMIVGGIILVFIDKIFKENDTINDDNQITIAKAFKIGCFQVLSILFPGLSRSAATIIGGLTQKLSRKEAAEFSFFLAVPTMLAASVKSFYDACKDNFKLTHHITDETAKVHLSEIFSSANMHSFFSGDNLTVLAIGCIVSFIVAMIAVKTFIGILQKFGFKYFGYYRILLGGLMLVLLFLKK